MRSKRVQRLLRFLITLLGAGLGAALSVLLIRGHRLVQATPLTGPQQLLTYTVLVLTGGLIFFCLRYPIMSACGRSVTALEAFFDSLTTSELLAGFTGLIIGLLIAMLLCQLLNLVGGGALAMLIAAILYILFGAIGWTMGLRREKDFAQYMGQKGKIRLARREEKVARKRLRLEGTIARKKVLDTSVLIDGRLLSVCRTGFIEGELVVHDSVLQELRHLADSADSIHRAKGKLGLENLEKMQNDPRITLMPDTTPFTDTDEVDVKLLRLADKLKAAVVTNDMNLNKIASVSGIPVLNLNELAGALKPVYIAGETITVTITKEGKEARQGVGYLDDGTMIVVDGGRERLGEAVRAVVTGMLQTNAGRMIFAKAED